MPCALLPCHLPLGERQLYQELSLHLLWGFLRPGASCWHSPEGRCLPLHGHWGWIQGGGYLLQACEQRPPPSRPHGLHFGPVTFACSGHPVAPLTTANANANPSSLLAPNDRNDKEPLLVGLVRKTLKHMVGLNFSIFFFRERIQKDLLRDWFYIFLHTAVWNYHYKIGAFVLKWVGVAL